MDVLEKVMDMQRDGMNDDEISKKLQNEGISPNDIDDSLNQARIKAAVSAPAPGAEAGVPPAQAPPIQQAPPVGGPSNQPGMQASMMVENGPAGEAPLPAAPEVYPPQNQQQEYYPPQEQGQDYYYPETPQAYPTEDYYAPQGGGMDTETISEIAEQVATEKLNEFKAKTGDLVAFKNTIQEKVEDIDDRLKRIEKSIDQLQQAIIGKIGEFGESNSMIHKDLDNLHGTVSKLMGPLIDNYNELKKIAR